MVSKALPILFQMPLIFFLQTRIKKKSGLIYFIHLSK